MNLKEKLASFIASGKAYKYGLVVIAVFVVLLILVLGNKARATGVATGVVVPATIVVPPVVAPPVVAPPPVVAHPPTAPVTQPSGGASWVGGLVMVGVGLYFWAVICVKEREVNPEGFWPKYLCLKKEQ
jgi:hypothetical protein